MTGRAVVTASICTLIILPAVAHRNVLRCNAACGYNIFTNFTDHGLETAKGPCETSTDIIKSDGFRFTFRSHNHTDWRLRIIGINNDTVTLSIKGAEIADAFSSQAGLRIKAIHLNTFYDTAVLSAVSVAGGSNAWNLTHSGNTLTISGGNNNYEPRLTIPLSQDFIPVHIIFDSEGTKGALITDILLQPLSQPQPCAHDITELQQYLQYPAQRREGYWQVLDGELDEALLRLGGDYRLALIADGNDFDIVYIEGTRINPTFWQPGMIKGRLHSTPFDGIYDMTWYDAEGQSMHNGLKAQFESDATLNLHFPYQGSRLRLQRCPTDH